MSTLSRSTSLLLVRAGLAVVVLSFTVCAIWTAGDLLGQGPTQEKDPPKKAREEEKEDAPKAKTPPGKKKKHVEEEEETPRNKPKNRKVIRVEEEEDPKAKPTTKPPNAPAANGDLTQLAEQAIQPSIKQLFRSLAHPYDVAVYKRKPGVTVNGGESVREEKIEPIPFYLGDNPGRFSKARILFTPLPIDDKHEPRKPFHPIIDSLELVRPYEEIAQNTVRRFLKSEADTVDSAAPGKLSPDKKLIAAGEALSCVLDWHKSARQLGKRSGKEWAAVEASLSKQLLDEVRLEQMRELAQAQKWDKVLDMAHRLAETYTDDVERARIFGPVAAMIKDAFNRPTANEDTRQDARRRLRKLEKEFPRNSALQPITDTLISEAEGQLKAAKKALEAKDEEKARAYLLRARETWPEVPGLDVLERELQREHPTLRVGVRGPLPRYFSPAWACTDNEYRAMDLLFESLVKVIPDEDGGFRYRLGLAESGPKVVPLGRQFELPRNARWSDDRKTAVHSTDIDFSMNLLKNGRGLGRSRVWGDLLRDMKVERDSFHLTIRLNQGFLDPLALMTFKILPREDVKIDGNNKIDVNSEEFAKNPITSGPFQLTGLGKDEADRDCLFFVANPAYGSRATKRDLPHIEKIRLYTYTDALEELHNPSKLDLVLDLTVEEAQKLQERQRKEGLPIEVPMPSKAVPNRRIYFLAINNHKLPDANLRRALALAIDRETLLKHFRAGLTVPLHRVINGPFPAGSWACNENLNNRPNKKGLDLFDPVEAKNRKVALVKPPARLKLKYPQGDSSLAKAMTDLCAQVKKLIEVELDPVPWDSYQLRLDVEDTQDYDLAYYHYDFPDDTYWLAPLLGPPPQLGERPQGADRIENIFRFNHSKIAELLAETESHRNFAVVQQFQWAIHKLLDEEMPFIPLWQLDPLLAYRREVKPVGLDPCKVFSNIEEWRVQSR